MKRKWMTTAAVLAASIIMSMTAFAGQWEKTEAGDRYIEDGKYVTGWHWIPAFWEVTGQPGEGEWCYYFGDDGYLWKSADTPDGNHVNSGGVWICRRYVMNRRDGIVYYGGSDQVYNETSRRAADEADQALRDYYVSQDVEGAKEVDAWFGYTADNVPKGSNDFLDGFYGQFTPNKKVKLKEIITGFMDQYIREDMSDFEKEMTIIQWLVENCEYEEGNVGAYNFLTNKKGQCAGYADAFLQLGKACGLEVRYVCNDKHAWNMICLDDEWYHVDVAFEDPEGKNDYGFGHLFNKFINLTDEQISQVSYHHTWDAYGLIADGKTYGPERVTDYVNHK